MKQKKHRLLTGLLLLFAAAVYYYEAIPAINIHAAGFWTFFLAVIGGGTALYGAKKVRSIRDLKETKGIKFGIAAFVLLFLVYFAGSLLSSPIFNAAKYQQLLEPVTSDFSTDIEQIKYNQIPLLDKESAELLGNRKMGSMVEMVSQFEVSSLYSQINYQGRPVRVTPLVYASPIKWLTNRGNGIPAYITIDMATQNTELVKLKQGMRYSQSEYFNRNIYRHLRFKYPTYIFDQLSFEIDEEGVPYWICPVKKFNIGLFGGQTIGRVVLCNAVTGECTAYDVEDCPTWVDRVYPADLLVALYDYHGTLKNGFLNSVLGQKGCLETTDGYNYLALEDDVWVYTGVTSVSGDRSNVGFVLMNQRTKETKYYEIAGAEEYSAMGSAEGQVQNLGYHATFPLLLNIKGEPTYFIALKDNAGLVKKYAMVNIQKYQNVAIGDNVMECEKTYVRMLKNAGTSFKDDDTQHREVRGTIRRIVQGTVDGNTHFYLLLEKEEAIYDLPLSEFIDVLLFETGDTVTLEYEEGDGVRIVTRLNGREAKASAETAKETTEEEGNYGT